jgi:hypothetical protein
VVSDRLAKIVQKSKDFALRTRAARALAGQGEAAKKSASRLAGVLRKEEEARRGNRSGLPLDNLTGELITDTPEAKRILVEIEARNELLQALVETLRDLDHRRGLTRKMLASLLRSDHDGLLCAVLDTACRWSVWGILPDLVELYRTYPEPHKYDLTHMRCRSFNDGKAKGIFMSKYGSPRYFRPRPVVVAAIRKTIREITGEECDSPQALTELLKRRDVKKRVRAGR